MRPTLIRVMPSATRSGAVSGSIPTMARNSGDAPARSNTGSVTSRGTPRSAAIRSACPMQVAPACTPIRSAFISPEYTSPPRLPHGFTDSSMLAASSTPRSGVWANRSGSSTPSAWISSSSDATRPPEDEHRGGMVGQRFRVENHLRAAGSRELVGKEQHGQGLSASGLPEAPPQIGSPSLVDAAVGDR